MAESCIKNADANWKGNPADPMQATLGAEDNLDSITFPPDNNQLLEENNNCKDVAMVSDAVLMSIDIQKGGNTDE